MKTNNKGISLIVLIITIIVMIILATAVILSLDGSGIIKKANEAKNKSDAATTLEKALLYKAEYMLDVQTGNIDSSETSLRDYVKSNLNEEERKHTAVTDDGEILTGLSEVAVTFVEENVEIGTVVTGYELPGASTVSKKPGQEYTISLLTSTTTTPGYTVDGRIVTGTINGTWTEGQPQTVTALVNPTWRYMGIGKDGNALIIADMPAWEDLEETNKVKIGYEGGYVYGPDALDEICDGLYTTEKGKARAMDIEDVYQLLDYTGPKGGYYAKDNVTWVGTKEPLTFGEIASINNIEIRSFNTPYRTNTWDEMKNIKSNYVIIKIEDNNNEEGEAIVFQEGAYHWYATSSAYVNVCYRDVAYGMMVHAGGGTNIGQIHFMNSGLSSTNAPSRVPRPVVALTGTLEVKIGTTVELEEVR